jgi:glucose-6-phosphate isomerase
MRKVSLDYNFVMKSNLDDGLNNEELESELKLVEEGLNRLNGMVESNETGFPKLVDLDDGEIIDFARSIQGEFEDMIIIGIGGSSLGFEAVANALLPYNYNALSPDKRGYFPRFWVMDNVDPYKAYWILEHCNPHKTIVLVISKSGSTVETAANFLVVYEWLLKNNVDLMRSLIAITDPKKGDLRNIVSRFGLKSFEVPENVGGRFSVLSSVGIVPFAILGIDIRELKNGGRFFIHNGKKLYLKMTAIYNAYIKRGKKINVLMPYTSRLKSFADWFCQLWGESLGKRYTRDGREIFFGSTPVTAIGTIDQHSQLQLYKEGPFDKLITFIQLDKHDFNQELDGEWYENYKYLTGVDLSRLLNVELQATEVALKKANRVSMKIAIDFLDEFSIGYLFMLYEYVVATLGIINNINPFDQPGVEEGKDYAYGILNRAGYEDKRKDYEASGRRESDYIV